MERVATPATFSAVSLSLLPSLASLVSLFISTAFLLLQFESGGSLRQNGAGSSLFWLAGEEDALEECVLVFGTEVLVVLEVGTLVVVEVVLEVGTVVVAAVVKLDVGTVVDPVVVVIILDVQVVVIVTVVVEGIQWWAEGEGGTVVVVIEVEVETEGEVETAASSPTTLRTSSSVTLLSQTCSTSCFVVVEEVEESGVLSQFCSLVCCG